MNRRISLAGTLLLWVCSAGWADGMMLPLSEVGKPIQVVRHNVTVAIDGRSATTHVDQVFRNEGGRMLEAEYIFPVPPGAAVTSFEVTVGDRKLETALLQGQEARSYYREAVTRLKDPGLLQYLGQDTMRARVIPLQPGQELRMVLDYQELLTADAGLVRYVYPLISEQWSAGPLEELTLDLTLAAERPLGAIYSPTHSLSVERRDPRHASASYAATKIVPDQDLELLFSEAPRDVALDLVPFRRDGDGYFLLLLSPTAVSRPVETAKTVVFVIDHSGSMSGDKIEQAKEALLFCLRNLRPNDQFNVVAYDDQLTVLSESLLPAGDAAARATAENFVKQLEARGGTDIHGGLLKAIETIGADELPCYLIFLTDGNATSGVTDNERIVADVAKMNEGRARLFTFGVGYDYNAQFIDKLALANGGDAVNVLPEENIEAKVANFYAKVSTPVLTDIKLAFGGVEVRDLQPRRLPDLFAGGELALVGRYAGPGNLTVTATGRRGAAPETYQASFELPAEETRHAFVPLLWATRTIGDLQDMLRLDGTNDEKLAKLVELSRRFGIVTEFTAFLATESEDGRVAALRLDGEAQVARARELQTQANEVESGDYAVAQAMNSRAQRNAAQVQANVYRGADGTMQEVAGLRNVAQRTFVQNETQWVDLAAADVEETVKVARYSPAYFQLAETSEAMADYLALGESVVVKLGEQAVEVADDGRSEPFAAAELERLIGSETVAMGRVE